MSKKLSYPDNVILLFRYKFCPMCRTRLIREVIFDDDIPRIKCPKCNWIQLISNIVGVAIIARNEVGVVMILPPNETGYAFPSGLVEYGEDPSRAALRELLEETGLEGKITDCLGWVFIDRKSWPGPSIQIVFEVEVTGGELKSSNEGEVKIFPLQQLPTISSTRIGNQKALQIFLSKKGCA